MGSASSRSVGRTHPRWLREAWFTFLLLLMGGMWGLQFAMLKLAAGSGWSEVNILVIALVAISLVYSAILVWQRGYFRITKDCLIFLIVTSVLGYVAPLAAAIYAAAHVPAGIMALIASLTPVITVTVALGLRTEPVSASRIAAVVLGSIAVGLVLWPELDLPRHGALAWMLLVLVVPLSYGVESIYVAARWPTGLTALQVVTGEAVVATVLLLPFLALFGEPFGFDLTWSNATVGIMVFVAAGVIEVLLYFYIIQHTGGVLVSFGTFIALFAGIGWGMLIFGETHGASVWTAVVVLLAALGLVCADAIRSSRAASRVVRHPPGG